MGARERTLAIKRPVGVVLLGAAIFATYQLSLHNYLLFHSLLEILSITVAFVMLAIAWNTWQFSTNHFLLFLGAGYAFIGGVDLLHTLAYQGMGVFRDPGPNLATQLWVGARYLEALTLVTAPVFLTKKARLAPVFLTYLAATTLLLLTVFLWRVFPACYVEGAGLTVFKKASEYAVSGILLIAMLFLSTRRRRLSPKAYRYLIASMALTICSEVVFTFYVSVFGLSNFAGHLLKLASFSLVYLAIVRFTLTQPYRTLFADLKESEEKLQHLSRHDPLTEVLNRVTLTEILAREAARAVRHDFPLALVMVDVNRFKEINDRFGHGIGDRVLQEVARILESATRATDYVFRFGGDEFLVVLPQEDGTSCLIMDRIRHAVAQRNTTVPPPDFSLSLAIGIEYFLPGRDDDVQSSLERADARMYEDKRRHKA
ncbi:MASE3 domain-containing protein [Candidatus Bipolaricaulota bacterium]